MKQNLKISNIFINIIMCLFTVIYVVLMFTSRSVINFDANSKSELAVLIKCGNKIYMNIYNSDGTLKTKVDIYTTILSFGEQKISMTINSKYIYIYTTDLYKELVYDFDGNLISKNPSPFKKSQTLDHAGGFKYQKLGLFEYIIIPDLPLSNTGQNILKETFKLTIFRILPYLIILGVVYTVGSYLKRKNNEKIKQIEEENQKQYKDQPKRWWE